MRHASTISMRGLAALLGGVALFSTVEVATKWVGGAALPFQMVFIRFFITGVALLGLSLPGSRRRGIVLTSRDYGLFALNGLVGIALALSLFHAAILVFDKAASCAVVFSANPIFVILLARFVNAEPWTRAKWISLGLGLTGIGLFAWESGFFSARSFAAVAIMVLGAFFFALSVCITRRVVARYGAMLFMGFSSLFGSLLVLPLAWAGAMRHGVDGLVQAWLPVLYIAVAGTAVAYGLYYYGLRSCTAFQAGMMFFLKPVLASLLAVAFLGERINAPMVAGTLLILSGLVVTVSAHLAAAPKPAPASASRAR